MPATNGPTYVWGSRTWGGGYLNVPVVVGDTLFVSSSGRRHNEPDERDGLYAVNRHTGEGLWFAHTESDANALTVHDGRVFVGTDGGRLYVVDAETGDVQATAPAIASPIPSPTSPTSPTSSTSSASPTQGRAPFRPSPLVADGCCADEEWPLEVGSIFGAPLPIADGVAFGDSNGNILYWHDGQLEVLAHAYEQLGAFRAPLVAVPGAPDEFIYASVAGEVGRMNMRSRRRWYGLLGRSIYAPPLVLEHRIIFTHGEAPTADAPVRLPVPGRRGLATIPAPPEPGPNLLALHVQTGELLWRATGSAISGRARTQLRTPAAVSDGRVYWQDPLEGILSLDPATGQLRTRAMIGACDDRIQWAGLVIDDAGVAYAPRFDGVLYGVELHTSTRLWAMEFGYREHAGEMLPEDIPCEGVGEPLYSTPALTADGMLYFTTGLGELHAFRVAR